MKQTIASTFFTALVVLVGCEREIVPVSDRETQEERVCFRTKWGSEDTDPESRTVLQENGYNVFWSPADKISIFKLAEGKTFWGRFTSANDQPAPEASFYGFWNQTLGSLPNPEPGYWAAYPDGNNITADYNGIFLSVPSQQTACRGSFAKDLFPAMAKCGLDDNLLTFYHVCGGVRFSVTQEGVTRLTLQSKGGEPLAGSFRAGFDPDGKPLIKSMTEGIDSVVVLAPDGGFQPGQPYFAVLLPQALSHGISIRLTKDKNTYGLPATAIRDLDRTLTVKRACFGRLEDIDKDLEYKGFTPTVSDDIISFADEKIKTRLVKAFDANQDGEISYAEAAAATSLQGVFGAIKTYKSFDEFQYFISITDIPDQCFTDCAQLTSITPPHSLRTIGRRAFKGCSALQSFLLPPSLESIGLEAFSGCTSISEITVGSFAHSTIGDVFPDSPIQRIVLSETLPSLPDHAFSGLEQLTRLILPESIRQIGSYAFAYCKSLASLRIPGAVNRIEEGTFKGCSNLAGLIIPDNNLYLGAYAFYDCALLTSVTIPQGQPRIEKQTFYNCASLTEISLPEGISSIGEQAFRGCSNLACRIVIPESVSAIGKGAFSNCASLPEITLPQSLTFIPEDIFYGCKTLASVIIPDQVTSIPDFAFAYCGGLESVTLPRQLTSLGRYAFAGCKIPSLVLPDGTERIGEYAFFGCRQLAEINIPDRVTSIEGSAFGRCSSLKTISLPETISSLRESIFRESGLVSITIPESVSFIGEMAFKQCTDLKSVLIPESVSSIGTSAFEECPSLESVDIPSSVKYIYGSSFYACSGLKWVIVRGAVPPTGYSPSFNQTGNCPIYVPDASVNAYKSTENWSAYADRIRPLSEFVE